MEVMEVKFLFQVQPTKVSKLPMLYESLLCCMKCKFMKLCNLHAVVEMKLPNYCL